MMAFKDVIRFFCSGSFWLFSLSLSYSASLSLSPINVEVKAPASSGTLTLHNTEDKPIAVQMRLFRWVQDAQGYENFESAAGLAAISPPIVKIPPKGRYTLRIIRLNPQPLTQEEAYRLYVDEIPSSKKEGPNQVVLHLRYNVPVVFVPAGDQPLPKLSLSVEKERGKTYLLLKNEGTRVKKFSKIKIQQGTLTADVPPKGTSAVLARSHRRFDISGIIARFKKGHNLNILVEHNGEPITLKTTF